MSVKHSVLALLSEEPATASHIKTRFADSFDGLWPLNMGQVAQTLSRLERDGLIATDGELTGPTGRRATSYAITDAGRTELTRMVDIHNPQRQHRARRTRSESHPRGSPLRRRRHRRARRPALRHRSPTP